jgi:proteasome accessory factor A
MGVETEYALSVQSAEIGSLNQGEFINRLLETARRKLVHLPGVAGGIYLENGSRFYIDYGNHPELCTPECSNPTDVVRYILAGERILSSLAREVERQWPYANVMLFKSNVDYGGAWTTWGCHESYSHAAQPGALSEEIIPHLVTRIIYTGAGGFDSTSRGLEFTLSPRVGHLANVISNNSTSDRGIFHTKDESLSRAGLHRLHIICGESLCSETAMWLKAATTALVVAMAEAGLRPGLGVGLRSPLEAIRKIASDPSCSASVDMLGGRRLSAIEIQYHYLTMAERYLGHSCMPSWSGEACKRWRAMLNRLLDAPGSVETTLDWAIKLAVYRTHVESKGISWEALPRWTRVLTELQQTLDYSDQYAHPLTAEFVLCESNPFGDAIARLTPYLEEAGLRWESLDDVIAVKRELFEIDTRFGQLGGGGLFARLDEAGVLTHHVSRIDNLEAAMTQPPQVGRARVRGNAVKQFAGRRGHYQCDWQGVFDVTARRVMDLSEPLESAERWIRFDEAPGNVVLPFLDTYARV